MQIRGQHEQWPAPAWSSLAQQFRLSAAFGTVVGRFLDFPRRLRRLLKRPPATLRDQYIDRQARHGRTRPHCDRIQLLRGDYRYRCPSALKIPKRGSGSSLKAQASLLGTNSAGNCGYARPKS